ncbi:MAG TPA: ABC transporter substrate-binding protein [Thermomicrobiales bacterium]|jgi:ABC-type glycerol-3-phosphate transport system substrate-binding protein|nr:ABC transporter substrate-binding protein [Thermomicrobiales bacterium]
MYRLSRRGLVKASGAAALVAATGVTRGSVSAQEQVRIRYGWWGGAERQAAYITALEAFEAANPDIDIEPEPAEYAAFQERMTTQIPAGNVPEIFWIASPQVLTYEANGLYRNLDDIETLDLSDYDATLLDSFRLSGNLNTMPFGIFAPAFRFNETTATAAGLTMPESGSENWTWDGLAQILTDYAAQTGSRAIAYNAHSDLPFEAWCRQRGEQLWTEDGMPGFTEDTVAAWFDWWENLRKAGAAMSLSEQEGPSPSWQEIGDQVLAVMGNSNHIVDDSKVFPDQTFRLRAIPIAADAPEGHKYLYTPRMAMYSGIDPALVPAAGRLMNYNVNDVAFIQTTGMSLGAPVNPRVRQEALSFANEAETEMLNMVETETGAPMNPRYEAPAGSSTWRDIMATAIETVALEQSSPSDAARLMIEDITAEIERARR